MLVENKLSKLIFLFPNYSCGKLFKDVGTMEFHAAKTNHSNFSESNEEKKPLTAEEKAEQMRLLEEKLKQKRKEREEKEKVEDLEREKSRVQIGKELAEAKRRLQEQEMKEIVETRRRGKIEEKQARDRVKAQIEADKIARRAKFGPQDGSSEQIAPPPPKPIEPATPAEPAVKKDYKETKLQVMFRILIVLTSLECKLLNYVVNINNMSFLFVAASTSQRENTRANFWSKRTSCSCTTLCRAKSRRWSYWTIQFDDIISSQSLSRR